MTENNSLAEEPEYDEEDEDLYDDALIAQSKLFDSGLILDSTCSDASRSWPRYADLRIDIRKEVRPDIVASAAYHPFKDELFGQVYCDPPHIIRGEDNSRKDPLVKEEYCPLGYP